MKQIQTLSSNLAPVERPVWPVRGGDGMHYGPKSAAHPVDITSINRSMLDLPRSPKAK